MGLLERVAHTDEAITWHGDMATQGRYTAGIAGETFFRAIKENAQLLATVCPECELTYVPPRMYCEQCFTHLDEWVEVGPFGRVHTFTVVHQDLDEEPLAEPQIIAFVQLDEADGGLVHLLGEVDSKEVFLGMPVEAVFKEEELRKGRITDIMYFRPI
ncbi:MAG: Zn-ribbon domain-containing OB-fold protein [Anaerolineae bacterium]|jgi:hypothetical protein